MVFMIQIPAVYYVRFPYAKAAAALAGTSYVSSSVDGGVANAVVNVSTNALSFADTSFTYWSAGLYHHVVGASLAQVLFACALLWYFRKRLLRLWNAFARRVDRDALIVVMVGFICGSVSPAPQHARHPPRPSVSNGITSQQSLTTSLALPPSCKPI